MRKTELLIDPYGSYLGESLAQSSEIDALESDQYVHVMPIYSFGPLVILPGSGGAACRMDLKVLSGMNDKATPSSGQIKETIVRLQVEFAADQIQLRPLGVLERTIRMSES